MFVIGVASTTVLMLAIAMLWRTPLQRERRETRNRSPQIAESQALRTLDQLCKLSNSELEKLDLAEFNLACLADLPDCEYVDPNRCLQLLNRYTASVRSQTEKNLYRFYANPTAYHNSEAYFRMLMLVTVLQQDFGVRYNPNRIVDVDYRVPADLFIHGLLGYGDGGTCVSIPTLYTAVAQRLGYPVSLVLTKEHLFCRWDGDNVRFNIEGTNQGMNVHTDEHYMGWPHPLEQSEVDSGQYLKSLDKQECLAVFVSMRAHCLEDLGDTGLALINYRQAVALAPKQQNYHHFVKQLSRRRTDAIVEKLLLQHAEHNSSEHSADQLTGWQHNTTASDIKRLSDSGIKF